MSPHRHASKMAIHAYGPGWKGSLPDDIEYFLKSLHTDALSPDEFRLAICGCGSMEFHLEIDALEGVAKRTCTRCERTRFVGDSEQFWDCATPGRWHCADCGSDTANVGIGFTLQPADIDVRWIFVATRCACCGLLACVNDWRVDSTPSEHLVRYF